MFPRRRKGEASKFVIQNFTDREKKREKERERERKIFLRCKKLVYHKWTLIGKFISYEKPLRIEMSLLTRKYKKK